MANVGILLVNLGTPEALTPGAIRRYLTQFLSDSRVVDLSPWLWQPLLRGVILPLRVPKLVRLYRSIWLAEGSPLLVYSQRQQAALAQRLPAYAVELAMTYGKPSIPEALSRLRQQGVRQLIILPLFPQYSSTTTAAVWDAVASALKLSPDLPTLHFIRDYAQHPAYIEGLAQSIRRSFVAHGEPDLLLFSYHGIPVRYAARGDDYPARCTATTQAVADTMQLSCYRMSYQSRFGREPWLAPYTDQVIAGLPAQGIKRIQVICPGFAADCLETLEEIAVQNRQIFLDAGGESYQYIPALNNDPGCIDCLVRLIEETGLAF